MMKKLKFHFEQENNSDYIRDIYSLYWQYLCNFLKSKYGNETADTEDIAQAAFEKFTALEDPTKVKNPRAFLIAMARNIAVDTFRKSKVRLAYQNSILGSSDENISDINAPENVLLEQQKYKVIKNVIEKLPEVQRTVLLLHRIDNLTYCQIAKKTGLSETTIRRHMALAIEKLHRSLKQAYGEAL